MVLPLLFVPLVYGISSTPDTCAQQRQSTEPICGPPDDEGWISCCVFISEEEGFSCEYCRELSPGNWECDTTLPDEAAQPTPPLRTIPPLATAQITEAPPLRTIPPLATPQITEAPPTPLPLPPTGPFISPEDGEARVIGPEKPPTTPDTTDDNDNGNGGNGGDNGNGGQGEPNREDETDASNDGGAETPSDGGGSQDTGPIT